MNLNVFKDAGHPLSPGAPDLNSAFADAPKASSGLFPISLYDKEKNLDTVLDYLEAREKHAHNLPVVRAVRGIKPGPTIDPQNPLVEAVPKLLSIFREQDTVILTAPTGLGKTTILPVALVEANRNVIVASPRRLLTQLAAERIATHFGEKVGHYVGFAHGYENRCATSNVIRCYTDSYLFVEQLLSHNPEERWPEKTVVIVDEFHEGGLGVHFLLAELRRQQSVLRRSGKEPFKIIVSSATLDSERLSETLHCPHLDIKTAAQSLPPRIFKQAGREQLGPLTYDEISRNRDVLVLAGGKPEIEIVIDEINRYCARRAACPETDYIPLHSRSGADARAQAAAPSNGTPRVIVSTLARTGVTFDVHTVIDLGRVRDQVTADGIETLRLRSVTGAELDQGYGRIGRIRSERRTKDPDVYIYLGEKDVGDLQPYPQAEIERIDLATYVLRLAVAGRSIRDLRFPIPPTEQQILSAYETLRRLGLFSPQNHVTKLGRTVARIPVNADLGVFIARAMAREENGIQSRLGVPGLTEATVTMAAIIVNEGLQEQSSATGKTNRPWARVCCYENGKNEQSSDMLAQLAIFRAAQNWSGSDFHENEVSKVAFERVKELRALLLKRLQLRDRPVKLETLRDDLLATIYQSFLHNVFVRDGEGWRDLHGQWKMHRFSVVGNNPDTELVTGLPQIIQGLDGEEHRIIFFATEVPVDWYREHAAPALKEEQPHTAAVLKPSRRERFCNRAHSRGRGARTF